MNNGKIYALYFSATGNTKKVTEALAEVLAQELHRNMEILDITLPEDRCKEYFFEKEDIVVVGAPTYAGKLPNKILPFYKENIKGNGARALGIVTYGNRSYDNSLAELCATLEENAFHIVGAATMVGEHPFSGKLGTGRPNAADLKEVTTWAKEISQHILSDNISKQLTIPGDATAPYYIPKQINGESAVFLKAKPKTDVEKCTGCGLCSGVCPMGSIDKNEPTSVTGICIKCQACVKVCPIQAKFFDDEMFLSHVKMLELNYTDKKKNLYIDMFQE